MTSGVVIVAMPATRSDLSQQHLELVHDLFVKIYKSTRHDDANADELFESVMTQLYAGSGSFSRYLRVKAPDHLIGVLAFVRMLPDNIAAPEMMEPVIFQSLGYNVARAHIIGSVFAASSQDEMIATPTELDYYVLKTIYGRKDIRIIRSFRK